MSGLGAVFAPMLFLRQACAAIVLIIITLGMQSAGMAGLIEWAKSHFARGVGFLPFGDQLFDRRLWGCLAPTGVAAPRAGRKCFRCAHVRPVGELPVCSCDPAPREQRFGRESSVSVANVRARGGGFPLL